MNIKEKALKELRDKTYVDQELKETYYPDESVCFKPTLKNAEVHIKLYEMMDEYLSLRVDYENCKSPSARGMITKRLEYLMRRIVYDFWVFDTGKQEVQ